MIIGSPWFVRPWRRHDAIITPRLDRSPPRRPGVVDLLVEQDEQEEHVDQQLEVHDEREHDEEVEQEVHKEQRRYTVAQSTLGRLVRSIMPRR